jgi:hypothetical protein
MRKSKRQKEFVANEIQQKLSLSASLGNSVLPMPHDLGRIGDGVKISAEEWEEWIQRQALHLEKHPDYDKIFARPCQETAARVWELVTEVGFREMKWPNAYRTVISGADQEGRKYAAKKGLVIVLDAFLSAGASHRQITYREIFDVLCRGFSDHFVATDGKVESVRDMRPSTVARCRRDLLLAGVVPNDLWSAVMKWSKADNPLFQVKEHNTGNRAVIRVLLPDHGEPIRRRYREISNLAKRYVPPSWGISVSFADEQLADPEDALCRVCAEQPYNVVQLGVKSKELLKRQAAVRLYLDISAFVEDYEVSCSDERRTETRLNKDFGIDASLPHYPRILRTASRGGDQVQTRWSKRAERVYYRSIELGITQGKSRALTLSDRRNYEKLIKCRGHMQGLRIGLKPHDQRHPEKEEQENFDWLQDGSKEHILKWLDQTERNFQKEPIVTPEMAYFQTDKAMMKWRDDVRGLLEEYDAARRHQQVFRQVYERVKHDGVGLKEIHSGFRRLITRRYQPLHFWPTYVTSKDRSQLRDDEDDEIDTSDEKKLESYRSRWFKGKDPDTGLPCELAGFDISSSQMQIIALFMADEDLENVTMTAPDSFKQAMAKWAWQMHMAGELKLRSGSGEISEYVGGLDERLQELVKELLMRVSYGSKWPTVEMDQRRHPKRYGPGWETTSAGKFVESFNKRYPGPARFRDICIRAAKTIYATNKFQGFEFIDPFDGATVRWNPVARDDAYPMGSDGDGLRISVPRGLPRRAKLKSLQLGANDGCNDLANKSDPYAGDYEVDPHELEKLSAPCLVHFLDAYYSSLVMEELISCGVECYVGIHDCWLVPGSRIEMLREAMDEAARAWYLGLAPVYERLLRHLETDTNKSKGRETKEKQETRAAFDAVCAAFDRWKERTNEKWWPRFRAKRVGATQGEGQS